MHVEAASGDEPVTFDLALMSKMIKDVYAKKWGCSGSDFASQSRVALAEIDGFGVEFTVEQFDH